MNALWFLAIFAGMLYGVLIDGTFWKIYGILVTLYLVFTQLVKDKGDNPKRKTLLISSWGEPIDPTSYIINDYRMDNAMAYVKKLNEDQKEVHVTMTHFMTHAAAWSLYKMRRDVGKLPWGQFKADKKYGVTVLVDVEGGKDLVPVTIWDGHKQSIIDIAKYMQGRVDKARKGKDERHNKATKSANFMPSFLAGPFGTILTYMAAVLKIELPGTGVRKDSFGQITLTNVGTMGYTSAFAPLCPPLHQLGLFCTGKIEKRAIVDPNDGDKIIAANMMTLVSTGDHRYGDAAIFVPMFKLLRHYIENPTNFAPETIKENAHYSEKKDN